MTLQLNIPNVFLNSLIQDLSTPGLEDLSALVEDLKRRALE